MKIKKIVSLDWDKTGTTITRVKLMDCVLLIRLADHNYEDIDIDDYTSKKKFNIRKSIVDDIHYYNIDELEKDIDIPVKFNKDKYFTVPKKGKERIKYEFEEKLKNAGVDSESIKKIPDKVDNLYK